jgi:hypothetical protein
VILEYSHFRNKLESSYYNKVLRENIEYYRKNGEGPYEYNGRFKHRVEPYYCAGYWQEYQEWLESEHNVVLNGNSLAFVSKNDALMFMVKWL